MTAIHLVPVVPRGPTVADRVASADELLAHVAGLRAESWRSEASCADASRASATWFYPAREWPERLAVRQARVVCAFCPVRLECTVQGLAREQPGIWGGLTQAERRTVRSRSVDPGRRLRMALALARRSATSGTWRIVDPLEWPVSAFDLRPGPGRGHKGPAALYAEEHGVSVRTARRRLRKPDIFEATYEPVP